MSTVQGSIAAEARLEWLTRQLELEGTVTISEAAKALDVSDMTIRRDLAELEDRGDARRVRGGATTVGPQPFAHRQPVAARSKAQIAIKLRSLVPDEGAIACDASSTVMRLAAGLDGCRDLTVITNGPDTFAALQRLRGVTPLLTGGRLDERTGSLVGPLACRAVEQFAVHTFFASAAAVSDRFGTMEATLEEADVKRSVAAGADRVVVAVDASKLGRTTVAVALEWSHVDVLVTELNPGDERLDPFRDIVQIV